MKNIYVLLALSISLLTTSCFKDNDDVLEPSLNQINSFIYRGLNFFYVYKSDVPELANDAFARQEDLNAFLDSFNSPESCFDFLTPDFDRFSIIVPNFIELENALSGVSLNNGMEFGLVRYPDGSGNVFGYIRLILPNSNASTTNLQRGMYFNTVNGQQMTENNFNSLLSPITYTIGLASFDGQDVISTGESVSLTKEEFSENPIFRNDVFEVGGRRIGYLMYNSFLNEFDSQLNAVFGRFAAEGITDLVLDFRYNGGGSVRSATHLASMVTGQFTGDVYFQEQWNEDRQEQFAQDGVFVDTFINGSESINHLNLNKVYVLTTSRSASASELVINSLSAYIDVQQIGDNTTGKTTASILLYDSESPTFRRSPGLNPNHNYAMLPQIFISANANGFTAPTDGLPPDTFIEEDLTNLGVLGDVTEPLLAAAIAQITGFPAPQINTSPVHLEILSESKASSPIYQRMIIE